MTLPLGTVFRQPKAHAHVTTTSSVEILYSRQLQRRFRGLPG
jgi:hypothetical protein